MKIMKSIFSLMVCSSLAFLLIGCSNEQMEVKSNTMTIEYGDKISKEINTYLNNSEEYCKDVEIIGVPENEGDKDYPQVGTYTLSIVRKKEEASVTVEIKDTVKPEFKNIEEKYEVEFGKKLNIKDVKAIDLSKVEITLDASEVNYKKAGKYNAIVIAEDEYGNRCEKEIVINVKEEVVNKNTNQSSRKPSGNKSQSTTSNSNDKNGDGRPYDYTIFVPDVDMETHVHEGPAVENMYFDDPDVLDEWAMNYLINVLGHGGTWGGTKCSCGKYYITEIN